MIRPVLIVLNLVLLLAMVFIVFKNDRPSNTIVVPSVPINEPPAKIPDVIRLVNASNAGISSFACEEITIRTWNKSMKNRLQGKLYYQLPKDFRFYVQSVMGLELDLGSNDTVFWFWSKRNKEPGLYYAHYEDYTKTRLKTPLNPMWLRASLGLDQIDTTHARFIETTKEVAVIHESVSATQEQIFVYTFVDKGMSKIRGFALTDCQNNVLATAEITYVDNLPVKIFYAWNEEERYMQIEFANPVINASLNPKFWEMPLFSPQINMAKDY
jgi:hypothetical protein